MAYWEHMRRPLCFWVDATDFHHRCSYRPNDYWRLGARGHASVKFTAIKRQRSELSELRSWAGVS